MVLLLLGLEVIPCSAEKAAAVLAVVPAGTMRLTMVFLAHLAAAQLQVPRIRCAVVLAEDPAPAMPRDIPEGHIREAIRCQDPIRPPQPSHRLTGLRSLVQHQALCAARTQTTILRAGTVEIEVALNAENLEW